MDFVELSPDAFDPSSPAVQADPYPYYPVLRDLKPVLRSELRGQPCWIVSRRADISKILLDPKTFSSRNAPMHDMLNADSPEHGRLRKMVAPMFTPGAIRPLRQAIEEKARSLCAAFVQSGSGDVITDFASPLTIHMIADLLGIAVSDIENIRRWSGGIADYVIALRTGSEPSAEGRAAMQGMSDFLMQIVRQRDYAPTGVIAVLARHWRDGDLSDDELIHFAILLFIAGHTTTTNLIGNAVYVLTQRPEDIEQIRTAPDFVDPFIDEVLRMRPSFQRIQRVTTREVVLHGEIIPAGSIIRLLLGSANRDPEAFQDPDTFLPRRAGRMHSSFGQGIHSCLGSWLARLEAGVAIGILARNIDHIALDTRNPPRPFTGGTFNEFGFHLLPVVLTARE